MCSGGDFMPVKQFMDTIDVADLEFEYKGKLYYICPVDNGYSCGEAGKDDTIFKTKEDILDRFLIEGISFREVLPDINW